METILGEKKNKRFPIGSIVWATGVRSSVAHYVKARYIPASPASPADPLPNDVLCFAQGADTNAHLRCWCSYCRPRPPAFSPPPNVHRPKIWEREGTTFLKPPQQAVVGAPEVCCSYPSVQAIQMPTKRRSDTAALFSPKSGTVGPGTSCLCPRPV